ncbi:MAG: AEC family transporter, partial [Lachnospiraceae bacterium]|nr:AEC family transporter [Lachnospiraceae bacterium]
MDNLILSFNVVLPIFLCILLGYFLRRIHMVDTPSLNVMNKLCFKVFLPIYLFNNIATTNLAAAFNGKLLATAYLGVTAQFILLMILIPRLEKENPRRGVLIQAMFRSNFALFGLPLALSLCGTEKVGPTSILVGFTVPLFNILAVVSLESFRGGKPSIKKMAKGIATNPLIIASLLGIAFNLLDFTLPGAVQKSVNDLGGVATPLSLVALGGSFTVSKVKEYKKQLTIGVLGRLVFSPLLMVSAGILLGFRNELLIPLLIMSGAPTAVSYFPMAQQMDGDGELAAGLVVFTSALAILSMFLWIFV